MNIKIISFLSIIIIITANGCSAEKSESMEHKFTNHLIDENSPYLLSHAHNPVNWYPWGEEALEKARREDKPIFLSIGYAACHWCHVMEHESFENEGIAKILNDNYVAIKVDREQRPDLDKIYMSFTTAMTGHGGWPMSVFLTPDLKPFYAGTYFPPDDKYGRPGFRRILTEIANSYKENKANIVKSSQSIFNKMQGRLSSLNENYYDLNINMIAGGAKALMNGFDHQNGGFGNAPKFPHALELSLFLRHYKKSGDKQYLTAVETALNKMADGGIYDHLGGGFARYATDAKWLTPHFEKMLYDNGLLVLVYAEAYQLTGNEKYKKVVRGVLDFILNEMTDKSGGFYSALDADSEGEEGKFYVWSKSEIEQILSDDKNMAASFVSYFNVTTGGNFEGHNILNLTAQSDKLREQNDPEQFDKMIEKAKEALLEKRGLRIRPLTDDKILTSWNGLALSALSVGYQITGDEKYLKAALKNAEFIKKELYQKGKLTHSYREGRHSDGEFLEDYAYYIKGLLDLYESDLSPDRIKWIDWSQELAHQAVKLFTDQAGNYYLRPDGQSDLIIRPQEETDGSVPSPGSIMIGNLLKLNRLTDKKEYLTSAEQNLKNISGMMRQSPNAMTTALFALDYFLNDKIELIIVGQGAERKKMLELVYNSYLPNRLIALSDKGGDQLPLFENRAAKTATAYLCINSACRLPVTTAEELKQQLAEIN